jgi:AcrR family transcriptional regulator
MPTSTFLNLSKEKQDNIIEASLKEFKRVLLKDASINKIIKDANIPRGSFYNYFEDINDLYIYSINRYKKKFINIFEEAIKNEKGDLIETTKTIYDNIIYNCTLDENKQLIKNIFLNLNYNVSIKNRLECEQLNDKYKIIELLEQIDKTKLNIKTEEELLYILDILIGIVMHGLIEIFLDNKNQEDIKEKITKQLEIIKRGIYKEEK